MYDYGLSILEQYGMSARKAIRIRGALLCHTENGVFRIKEFHGSEQRLRKQQELLEKLEKNGFYVDSYVENTEKQLINVDSEENSFTLQKWYECRECDTKQKDEILKSVEFLARLHKVMQMEYQAEYQGKSLKDEYIRHNQELRKIRKFIRRKGAANSFEKLYLQNVEEFLEKGERASCLLEASGLEILEREAKEKGWICHGAYNQHNIRIDRNFVAITEFSHWNYGIQISDLYAFMRKILEKYNWNTMLAEEMLMAYQKERGLRKEEWEYLRIRFLYPEKFWKLANFYFSHNKAWISEKNTQKLRKVIEQKESWDYFSETYMKEKLTG